MIWRFKTSLVLKSFRKFALKKGLVLLGVVLKTKESRVVSRVVLYSEGGWFFLGRREEVGRKRGGRTVVTTNSAVARGGGATSGIGEG